EPARQARTRNPYLLGTNPEEIGASVRARQDSKLFSVSRREWCNSQEILKPSRVLLLSLAVLSATLAACQKVTGGPDPGVDGVRNRSSAFTDTLPGKVSAALTSRVPSIGAVEQSESEISLQGGSIRLSVREQAQPEDRVHVHITDVKGGFA